MVFGKRIDVFEKKLVKDKKKKRKKRERERELKRFDHENEKLRKEIIFKKKIPLSTNKLIDTTQNKIFKLKLLFLFLVDSFTCAACKRHFDATVSD